jgi:hypothetical protein
MYGAIPCSLDVSLSYLSRYKGGVPSKRQGLGESYAQCQEIMTADLAVFLARMFAHFGQFFMTRFDKRETG